MDVYCHHSPPESKNSIQEAKLCELITLVTNYSCGEDHCTPESGSLPLDWAEYRSREHSSLKQAQVLMSIFKNLKKVYNYSSKKRSKLGKKSKNS